MIEHILKRLRIGLTVLVAAMGATPALAGKTTIAVAANFTAAAKDIAQAFEIKTGHKAVLAFGSTGRLFAQIVHGAPFDVFLAADQARPEKAEADGFAVPVSRFTYATGKIVLYSQSPEVVDDAGDVLTKPETIVKIAIANPKTAPYGAAAVETMQKLGVYDMLKAKFVIGDNIAQTHQFVVTENATLGFVAYSQVIHADQGSSWVVPEDLYAPIRQDVVLLKNGENSEAAQAFLAFLKSADARTIIESSGYGTGN